MTGGRLGSRPGRRAKMLPIRSTRTVQPAASHQPMKSRRASPSRSLAANRHTPPLGVAPICANSIRLAHNRSPFICRLRITPSRLIIRGSCPFRACGGGGISGRLFTAYPAPGELPDPLLSGRLIWGMPERGEVSYTRLRPILCACSAGTTFQSSAGVRIVLPSSFPSHRQTCGKRCLLYRAYLVHGGTLPDESSLACRAYVGAL